MKIIKKINNTSEDLNSETVDKKEMNATYINLAYQKYDEKMDPLKKELNEIEDNIRKIEKLDSNEKNSDTVLIYRKLIEKQKDKQKEINLTNLKYGVDSGLPSIAASLDNLENYNKGVDLLFGLNNDLVNLIPKINAIEQCFKGYAPAAHEVMKSGIVNLINVTNTNMKVVGRLNKEKLEKQFYELLERQNNKFIINENFKNLI